jgi:hypothetical protein
LSTDYFIEWKKLGYVYILCRKNRFFSFFSVGGRDRVGIVTRKNFGSRTKLGSRPKIFSNIVRELVISFSHDFRVYSLWVTIRLGRDPKKNSGRDPRSGHDPRKIRVATRLGSRPGVGSTGPGR